MSSVADMLRPEFAHSWHEAVAVVQEVASQLSPGFGVPAPHDLLFGEDGTLSLGFGSETGGSHVAELAGLLQGLLEGTDPPSGLGQLAAENASSTPAHATLEGFSRALAFYERPNRVTDIAAVASRMHATAGLRQSDEEFARLREKVSAKAEAEDGGQPDDASRRKAGRATSRQKAMLAAAVAAALLLAIVGNGGGDVGGTVDRVELHIAGLVSSVLERFGFGTPTASEILAGGDPTAITPSGTAEAPIPADEPDRAGSSAPVSVAGIARTRAPRRDIVLPAVVREEGVPTTGEGPVPIIEFATGEPLDMPAMVPGDLSVYSAANPEVRPPSFLRPQLPREPAPGEDTGYFDITVNEQGMVEQVRLHSPTWRFQERILVAAAKAWKFTPARLDGRPVRYRMRIPIILKGLP